MLINFNYHLKKIKDVRNGKIKEGLKLEVENLDEHLRFKRQFNVILGHANVGKTSIILYLMLLYTLKHKLKWLVFSAENDTYTLIKKLIEFMCTDIIQHIEETKFLDKAFFIDEHFKFLDCTKTYDYKQLLKEAKEIKSKFNYDGFLIDPYNALRVNKSLLVGNKHEYDYDVCSEFRIFTKKNNCAIWLNTHANTEALRKIHPLSHTYAGHPIPPNAADVEGGGKFVNRADDFWVLHRYLQHKTEWMISHLHVRKVKDTDTGGRQTDLDEPLKFRNIINNVGFQINGKNIVPLVDKDTPF
tara:strand:- start:823 stop:1722 length:900 start_codon:yes stop_codon:yes gene_type:complete